MIASVGLRAGLSPTQAKEAEVELRRRAALLEKMRLVRMTQLAELAHMPDGEKSEEQEKEHHAHQQLLKHFLRHDIHDVTSHLDDKDD